MKEKKLAILTIITGFLFTFFLVFLVPVVFGHLFKSNVVCNIIFLAIPIVLAALFIFLLSYYINKVTLLNNVEIENETQFGKKSDFYNLYLFQRTVYRHSRMRDKQKQHVIAFTFSNLAVSQNVNRNQEIFGINGFIASYLNELAKDVNMNPRDLIFAFNHGTFLIYTFKQNEQTLNNICETLSRKIYEYANENCRHVSVQPFFGISVVNDEESIVQHIENAQIAREFSERNFETVTFYQPSFRKTVNTNDIDELQAALENNEFVVYYQPKYDLLNKRFISSEALIRWKSEKYGLLAPTKFLGKAEAVGLTHEIDTFVLRKVCENLNDLRRRGKRILPVSVNFSLYEFYSASFLDTIVKIMEDYDIPTHLIEIEITEATSQANQFLSISIIKKLKDRGIRVLMDDFGIGFSNVCNLKKIPFDAVKIDKSFIDDIATDTKAREIVKFLIGLCKVNGMEVIAEGVDSKDQVEILRRNKCDTIQGFYYSQALSKEDFEKFLANNPFEKKEDVRKWF